MSDHQLEGATSSSSAVVIVAVAVLALIFCIGAGVYLVIRFLKEQRNIEEARTAQGIKMIQGLLASPSALDSNGELLPGVEKWSTMLATLDPRDRAMSTLTVSAIATEVTQHSDDSRYEELIASVVELATDIGS